MPDKTPITVAHGDGIGPEIMAATLEVLEGAGARIAPEVIEIGEKVYQRGVLTGIEPSAWDSLRRTRVFLGNQFLVESTLLSALAAAAGAALAWATLPALVVLARQQSRVLGGYPHQPAGAGGDRRLGAARRPGDGRVSRRFKARASDIVSALRDGGRTVAGAVGSHRARQGIVAAQVAVSLVLLIGAALLVTSFARLRAQPTGLGATNVFVAGINVPTARYPDAGAQERLYTQIAAALNEAPGVERAALSQTVPLLGPFTRAPYAAVSGVVPPLNERPLGLTDSVTPGYFETLGIPLIAGRDFTERDTAQSPLVAIVSPLDRA